MELAAIIPTINPDAYRTREWIFTLALLRKHYVGDIGRSQDKQQLVQVTLRSDPPTYKKNGSIFRFTNIPSPIVARCSARGLSVSKRPEVDGERLVKRFDGRAPRVEDAVCFAQVRRTSRCVLESGNGRLSVH